MDKMGSCWINSKRCRILKLKRINSNVLSIKRNRYKLNYMCIKKNIKKI